MKKHFIGQTIFIKNDSDQIKQLISINKGQFHSSHQNYYGKPIVKEGHRPILSGKYGNSRASQGRRVSYLQPGLGGSNLNE